MRQRALIVRPVFGCTRRSNSSRMVSRPGRRPTWSTVPSCDWGNIYKLVNEALTISELIRIENIWILKRKSCLNRLAQARQESHAAMHDPCLILVAHLEHGVILLVSATDHRVLNSGVSLQIFYIFYYRFYSRYLLDIL